MQFPIRPEMVLIDLDGTLLDEHARLSDRSRSSLATLLDTDDATAESNADLIASAEREIDSVTTPRGCTISGLNEMEHQGLSSALIKGIVTSAVQAGRLIGHDVLDAGLSFARDGARGEDVDPGHLERRVGGGRVVRIVAGAGDRPGRRAGLRCRGRRRDRCRGRLSATAWSCSCRCRADPSKAPRKRGSELSTSTSSPVSASCRRSRPPGTISRSRGS